MSDWWIFRGYGDGTQNPLTELPPAPPWRTFPRNQERQKRRGATYQASREEIEVVNAALRLRRPILITGKPGVGKSSLAYAVAYELALEDVLYWSITTRTTLNDGLYQYDAIGRLREANWQWARWKESKESEGSDKIILPDDSDIGRYIRLGPLGTALLPSDKPRVLLIDEIDKSDIDLPNDLLHVFEEGKYEIPELMRLPNEPPYQKIEVNTWDYNGIATIERGRVECSNFPFVIFTSNDEREFPPAFKRRCLQLTMQQPELNRLHDIIKAQFVETLGQQQATELLTRAAPLIDVFIKRRDKADLATDQLLNAIHLLTQDINLVPEHDDDSKSTNSHSTLIEAVLRHLTG
jgi:MoxR-like ATPase